MKTFDVLGLEIEIAGVALSIDAKFNWDVEATGEHRHDTRTGKGKDLLADRPQSVAHFSAFNVDGVEVLNPENRAEIEKALLSAFRDSDESSRAHRWTDWK